MLNDAGSWYKNLARKPEGNKLLGTPTILKRIFTHSLPATLLLAYLQPSHF
jgi:hypothetical protein